MRGERTFERIKNVCEEDRIYSRGLLYEEIRSSRDGRRKGKMEEKRKRRRTETEEEEGAEEEEGEEEEEGGEGKLERR